MRLLLFSARITCLCIWLVAAMYGAYTHRASRDYDSELVQTGSVFEHANEGVRQHVSQLRAGGTSNVNVPLLTNSRQLSLAH